MRHVICLRFNVNYMVIGLVVYYLSIHYAGIVCIQHEIKLDNLFRISTDQAGHLLRYGAYQADLIYRVTDG